MIGVVAVLLVVGGVAALVLSGGGTEDRAETAATDSPAPETDEIDIVEERTSPGADPAAPVPADRPAIIEVLHGYEAAYSEASLEGMADLFTSDVERHGLAAGGCATVSGKSAVLAAYSGQFAENGSVTYELVGLDPGSVDLFGEEEARIETEYSIPSEDNSGAISFTLEGRGSNWHISAVDATCEPSSS